MTPIYQRLRYALFLWALSLSTLLAQTTENSGRAPSSGAPSSGVATGALPKISARIKGLANTTCYLAHFYGPTQFIPCDTAKTDADGRVVFESTKSLPEGLYMVVVNGKSVLQLVIGEQQFSFEADTTDVIRSMRVTGSRENTLFYDYQKFFGDKVNEMQTLQRQKRGRTDAAANQQTDQQIAAIRKEMDSYRTNFLRTNAGTLTAKLFLAASEPETPAPPRLPNGRPDSAWVFNYYKNHFFDNFDFSDERMRRTPFLQQKLDRYIKELTVQTVDSLIPAADYLVGKAKANKEILSYTIWYITNQYEQQKTVLNTEGFFIHMAEKYWLSGIMPVSDPASLKDIRERVQTLKPLLAGKTLPNIALQDTLGRVRPLHELKSEYTVVFFYDPECGHCRESAPRLKKFYQDHKAQGVQIYAVALEKPVDTWKKFIREFKIGDLVNVYGPSAPVNYRQQYDVYSTPTVYVLDRNKKILARRLPVEDLEGYFQFLQRQRKTAGAKQAAVGAKSPVGSRQ